VQRQSPVQIAETVLSWPEGTRLEIRAPLVQGRKGEFRELFESARKQGFVRAVVDGELIELADPPKLNKRQNHSISVVVDRLVVRAEDRGRLTDSLETALRLAEGLVEVLEYPTAPGGEPELHLFSERYGCPCAASRCPSSSRASSRSTRPSARARRAAAWGRARRSVRSSCWATRASRSSRAWCCPGVSPTAT
jgi:excinuclease ABC subunit A